MSYVTADLIKPTLEVDTPGTSEILAENVTFIIDGENLGSGIYQLKIEVDGEEVYTGHTVPLEYTWVTREYENSNHTITFSLTDNAMNTKTLSYDFEVQN
ncbi:MAG: Ig-like domain-containing protein [Candidatus Heimdallarchaeaceae archaeon]